MSKVQGMNALRARLKAIGDTKPTMRALQFSTIHEAQARVHRRTGHLQRSIVPGPVSETHAIVEARTPYAAAEELGRKAVVIVPKKARVLAWGGPRRLTGALRAGAKPTNFAMRVHQKARKGHPYLIPGAKAALKKAGVLGTVIERWNRAA